MRARDLAIESDALPDLGTLQLIGTVWPATDSQLSALRQFRADHTECTGCCGPTRTHLMGVRVDAMIAQSLRARTHLNDDHADDAA